MAATRTSTSTFTRIELLTLQMKIALKKTLNISEESFDRYVRQGLRLKLIGSITIYAIQADGRCRAQLRLKIDWERHRLHIEEGRERLPMDRRWQNQAAPELQEYVEGFVNFVAEHDLTTKWTIGFAPGADYDYACRTLGLDRGSAGVPRWAGRAEGFTWDATGLDELKIGCYFVFDVDDEVDDEDEFDFSDLF